MEHPRLREQFGSHLARLSRLWRNRLDERLAPLGLTQAKWVILLHLSKAGGALGQKDLVDRVGVEAPTMVRVLDGLQRMGLIERRDCPGDRRSKSVHLTAAATPIIARIDAIARDLRAETLAGIDDASLGVCADVLAQIARNLGSSLWEGAP
jgi:MarR family transcriptional regulator for hemolysin